MELLTGMIFGAYVVLLAIAISEVQAAKKVMKELESLLDEKNEEDDE